MALVLAETAAGATALLWLTRLWGSVKRGFFILAGALALGSVLLAALASSSAVASGAGGISDADRLAVLLVCGTAVVTGLSVAALVLRLDGLGRAVGTLAVPAGVAALVSLALVTGPPAGPAMFQLFAGAAFMGAATDGLLLGHWYLTDRRLPREHIQRYALLLIAAIVLEVASVLLLGFGETRTAPGLNPFLAIPGLATWLALGMVACTALIAVLIRASLRSPRPRAVQAATGFFYLAVITAFTAELAAKVRLLG
jgi:hypothetical protein